MTVDQAYYEFHLLLNKNAGLKNTNVSKPNYVFLFNREGLLRLREVLTSRRSSYEIHDFKELLEYDVKLDISSKHKEYDRFLLPENYFEFVSSESVTKKNSCINKTVNYLYKPKDIKQKSADSYYVNFDFEESVCDLSGEFLIVYKKEYDIRETVLSYYKEIPKIDMEGYQLDGIPSTNIHPQMSDRLVHIINSWVVAEVVRQFEDGNKLNLSKDRITI